jgi:hypothetical protein
MGLEIISVAQNLPRLAANRGALLVWVVGVEPLPELSLSASGEHFGNGVESCELSLPVQIACTFQEKSEKTRLFYSAIVDPP